MYLRSLDYGDQFILKGEPRMQGDRDERKAREGLNFGFEVAKQVAHGADSRALDGIEMRYIALLFGRDDLDAGARATVQVDYNAGQQWILMQYVSNLTDFKAKTGYRGGKLLAADKGGAAAVGAQLLRFQSSDSTSALGSRGPESRSRHCARRD